MYWLQRQKNVFAISAPSFCRFSGGTAAGQFPSALLRRFRQARVLLASRVIRASRLSNVVPSAKLLLSQAAAQPLSLFRQSCLQEMDTGPGAAQALFVQNAT